MFAITGISGRVGGATARALLSGGHGVRAVVRDRAKAAIWRAHGAEVAVADFTDRAALQTAFEGVDGVFVMTPGNFDPAPGFPEIRAIAGALRDALQAAAPPRIVCLSSIGAQHASGVGLLTQLFIFEREMRHLAMPRAILRPAWFMENAIADIGLARIAGVMPSYLAPLDQAIPMVATADVGAVAADVLTHPWQGSRIIEIEGPRHYAPNDVAATLASLLQRPVRAEAVPHNDWAARLHAAGHDNPIPRIRMLDGFNSGWIAFAEHPGEHVVGHTPLEGVLRPAIASAAHAA